MDGEWSVEKVLQVIINNCRSWRGEGMKVKYFTNGFSVLVENGNPNIIAYLFIFGLIDVYPVTIYIRARESSRGVLYSICVATNSVSEVLFLYSKLETSHVKQFFHLAANKQYFCLVILDFKMFMRVTLLLAIWHF